MIERYNILGNATKYLNLPNEITEELDISSNSERFQFLKQVTDQILSTCDPTIFSNGTKKVFIVTDYLRAFGVEAAYNFYSEFYQLLTQNFNAKKEPLQKARAIQFVKNCDLTEIYFNLSCLYRTKGDVEYSIKYLALADKEFSNKNKISEGNLIRELFETKHSIVEAIITVMRATYFNLINITGDNYALDELLSSYSVDFERKNLVSMLLDFKPEMLLQFLVTFRNLSKYELSWNLLELKTNFQTVRQFRLLGDFCWLFESYLSEINSELKREYCHRTMHSAIEFFLDAINENSTLDHYRSSTNKFTGKNGRALTDISLLINQYYDQSMNKEDRVSAGLNAIRIYRNYSSHKLTTEHNLSEEYILRMRLVLLLLTCFLIVFSCKKIHKV